MLYTDHGRVTKSTSHLRGIYLVTSYIYIYTCGRQNRVLSATMTASMKTNRLFSTKSPSLWWRAYWHGSIGTIILSMRVAQNNKHVILNMC